MINDNYHILCFCFKSKQVKEEPCLSFFWFFYLTFISHLDLKSLFQENRDQSLAARMSAHGVCELDLLHLGDLQQVPQLPTSQKKRHNSLKQKPGSFSVTFSNRTRGNQPYMYVCMCVCVSVH